MNRPLVWGQQARLRRHRSRSSGRGTLIFNVFIIISMRRGGLGAARCGRGSECVNEYDPMTLVLLTFYFSTGLARRGLTQTEPCYSY
jgi:hypothetical protein